MSKVLRLPRRMKMDTSKVLRLPENCNASENVAKVLHLPRKKKRLSTRYDTRLNVTKCHACHAKRSNAAFQTSKNDPSCRTYHNTAIRPSRGRLRTVADGCAASSEHSLNPQTLRVKREPCYASGKKNHSPGPYTSKRSPIILSMPCPCAATRPCSKRPRCTTYHWKRWMWQSRSW